ncbi:MAG: RluA family pseudouridine synthase [Gemmataceae bacterium]
MTLEPFDIMASEEGHTLAKVLRSRLHESQPSWAAVRQLIDSRRVQIGTVLCTDSTRRLKEGERITLLAKPERIVRAATTDGLVIRFLDEHVVVVEKPSKMNTVRHPAELEWSEERRRADPTLQDVTQWAIGRQKLRSAHSLPPLRIVQRLDRDTSGLVMFARSVLAERHLGMQFRKHTVQRRYLAVVPGQLTPRTFRSVLVRDRGDGRRGSTTLKNTGKEAITHISIEERLNGATLLSCRLETGRTHQIRIHLSEAGHPICGEAVYTQTVGGVPYIVMPAPRLALHATELGFIHPVTNAPEHYTMPLPADLAQFVERLRLPKSSS